jgi:hypothetical protein
MQPRPVNQEMNTDLFQRMLGMPSQAVLLAMGVLGISILAGGFLRGFPCGLAFYFVLRRFLKDDPAYLDWLIVTLRQKTAYGPKGVR